MEVQFDTHHLIIVFGAIVLLVALFFLLKKIIRILLISIVIFGLLYYVFIFSNILKPNSHKKYSIESIKEKFCTDMQTFNDSVRCELIIDPIYNDIKSKFTEEQLLDLEKNPVEYFNVLNDAIKRNKKDILKNLAKNKQEQLWNKFISDLKNNYSNEIEITQ